MWVLAFWQQGLRFLSTPIWTDLNRQNVQVLLKYTRRLNKQGYQNNIYSLVTVYLDSGEM